MFVNDIFTLLFFREFLIASRIILNVSFFNHGSNLLNFKGKLCSKTVQLFDRSSQEDFFLTHQCTTQQV